MVIVNLETLTDSELQSIAEIEKIDDYEAMNREELIEELKSIYEGSENSVLSGTLNQKYISTLTPREKTVFNDTDAEGETNYNNRTFIYLVQKDPCWAYAFWHFSENDLKKAEKNASSSLFLELLISEDNSNYDLFYNIRISANDTNHIIELPLEDRNYRIQLVLKNSEKEITVLAKSNTVERKNIFFKPGNTGMDTAKYELLIKPLISIDGAPVNCSDIINYIYNISQCGENKKTKKGKANAQ